MTDREELNDIEVSAQAEALAEDAANETVMAEGSAIQPFSSVLVIGIGLIGGSIAAALKALPQPPRVLGVDVDRQSVSGALEKCFIDEGALATDDVVDGWLSNGEIELIILAIPVSGAGKWLERISRSSFSGIITDVSSTKAVLCAQADGILKDPRYFIPGHPMAGSEVNGLEGARANLFQGAHWILCPNEDTDPEAYLRLHGFVTSLGARTISVPRSEHDSVIAIVSHVPHMVASALVQLAGDHADKSQGLFRLAAGGFKDTTRIAAGSPELWCGIALDNKQALAAGLAELRDIIDGLERSIRTEDRRVLTRMLENAAELRRAIPASWVPSSERLVEVRIPMTNHSGAIAQVTGFAGKVGCNIQSIDIDHITEDTAILELILTDEGDFGGLTSLLLDNGFDVSIRPLVPKE